MYPIDKVPVPTSLNLEATTLLKMLKTLPMMKHILACDGLDPHLWRSFWILLIDLEDDDTLNKMMINDDLEDCGDPSYALGYDQFKDETNS